MVCWKPIGRNTEHRISPRSESQSVRNNYFDVTPPLTNDHAHTRRRTCCRACVSSLRIRSISRESQLSEGSIGVRWPYCLTFFFFFFSAYLLIIMEISQKSKDSLSKSGFRHYANKREIWVGVIDAHKRARILFDSDRFDVKSFVLIATMVRMKSRVPIF